MSYRAVFASYFLRELLRCLRINIQLTLLSVDFMYSESTSELGEGNMFPMLLYNDRESMIYAVFTTPRSVRQYITISRIVMQCCLMTFTIQFDFLF